MGALGALLPLVAFAAWLACDEPRRHLPPGASAPLFSDLGDHHLAITTRDPLVQRYFDQGLVLAYGFNHAESVRSFREAQRLDPACAACYWGEAYALGPNINRAMPAENAAPAWRAVENARRAAALAAPFERSLVQAITARYAADPPGDRAPLDRAYADAMRNVVADFPDSADALALFGEALLDTMPWDYLEGGRPKPATDEAVAALERALALEPRHPAALHFLIHALEAHAPERAESAADRLRGLVPGAGHLVHMPSHIYLRVGRYHDASLVNEEAAAADEAYITQCRAQGHYPSNYYPHNIDFLQASATYEGRSGVALAAVEKFRRMTPPDAVREFPNLEEFLPRQQLARLRFGRFEEVLAEPEPTPGLPYWTGAWHYARGVAFAATGRIAAAERERNGLAESRRAWDGVDRVFLSGARPDQLLAIADRVLAARIASARGDHGVAIDALRAAVVLQDALPYSEPPSWYLPVRDVLGQALLDAERPADAEAVFREQLARAPESGWTLFGLAASLRARARADEARDIERRFETAWQRADLRLDRAVF